MIYRWPGFDPDTMRIGPNKDRARIIAVWANGDFSDNFEYNIAGTPCENILSNNFCSYPKNVRQLFPEDSSLAEMQIEGYMGTLLFDSAGQPMGLLAIMHDREMEQLELAKSMLTIFATRAAAELERRRTEKEREQLLKTLAVSFHIFD